MLSEAVAVTVTTPDTVAPELGAVMLTAGGVVSVALYVTLRVAVPVLPTASRAVTVSTLVPATSAMPLADQLVVPVAMPLPPRSFTHETCVTPTLSDAVPPRVRGLVVVVYVADVVGVVIVTVGGVVSVVEAAALNATSCMSQYPAGLIG